MTREVIRYKLNELRMMLNDGEHTEEQGILVDIIKELDKAENKGDLISRQAVLDELEKWDWQDLYLPIHFKQILDDLPSAENKGEWIYDKGIYNWRCSRCGQTPPPTGYVGKADFMATHFKFCNHCGADMREPKGEKGTE